MLARPMPDLAAFLLVHSQASLQMALQKLRYIRFANDQHLAFGPLRSIDR
jgi:hypothetical protein